MWYAILYCIISAAKGEQVMGTRAKIYVREPKTTLTIRIPVEEKRALVEEAKKRGTTVTELIRRSLVEASIIKKQTGREWPRPRAIGVGEFDRRDLYE